MLPRRNFGSRKKTRDAAKTVTLAAEQKDRSTRLFVEHVNGLGVAVYPKNLVAFDF
jgi:hypothetical protein